MERIILHSDLNNFYASVECLYNPEIRNSPVAVCGSQSTRHGIVLAKNYVAKNMGVKTGEAAWEAKKKCPGLVVVPPNYPLYIKFSLAVRKIYETYTDLVESFGMDENWLDVTQSTKLFGDGPKIAHEIKDKIKNELGITASVGVSYNKIFAKLGSDMKKPDAVTVITQDNFKDKVWTLPVEDLLYVGKSTRIKLNRFGITTIGDLANAPVKFIKSQLGKWGEVLWLFANGFDMTPVTRVDQDLTIKGIGNSLTTPRDLLCNEDAKTLIYVLSDSVSRRLRRQNLVGRTVQISIRDSELCYVERQAQLEAPTHVSSEIAEKAYEIFAANWDWSRSIRALGVRVTDLVDADTFIQLSLLGYDKHQKRELIEYSIDRIRERFGHYSVQRALFLKNRELNANPYEDNTIHPVPYFR